MCNDPLYPSAAGTAVMALAGSPGHVAWMTYSFNTTLEKAGVEVKDPSRISVLGAGEVCRTNTGPGFALNGDQLAVSGCSGVTIRDLSRPGAPPEVLAPAGGPVKLADAWAAWQTDTGYELLDRATGTRTTFDVSGLPGERQAFDVSPEGVLAVALSLQGAARRSWRGRHPPSRPGTCSASRDSCGTTSCGSAAAASRT